MEALVAKNLAVYEPPKQARSILLYWRLPEEWAEVLYDWVTSHAISRTPPARHLLTCIVVGVFNRAAEHYFNIHGHYRSTRRIPLDEYTDPTFTESYLDPRENRTIATYHDRRWRRCALLDERQIIILVMLFSTSH